MVDRPVAPEDIGVGAVVTYQLRSGEPDERIAALWRTAMWGKKAGSGLDDPAFLQPQRPMSAIGG